MTERGRRRFDAVVFDMDGVLLDSEPLHHQVLNRVLAAEGHTLTFDAYHRYIGTTLEYTWSDLADRLRLRAPIAEYLAAYDAAILESYRTRSVIASGARELLDLLRVEGLRLAVASSSERAWVETALRALSVREMFETVVTGDMVQHSKPDPEIYLLAARTLQVSPQRCLAIEDAPKGVASAHAAGMTVVGVRTAYTAESPLSGATLILDELDSFPSSLLFADAHATEQ